MSNKTNKANFKKGSGCLLECKKSDSFNTGKYD